MLVELEENYGAYLSGGKEGNVWSASLEDTEEERDTIAEHIATAILSGDEVTATNFKVALSSTVKYDCEYSDELAETLCKEKVLKFEFLVDPADYLEEILVKLLKYTNKPMSIYDHYGIDYFLNSL